MYGKAEEIVKKTVTVNAPPTSREAIDYASGYSSANMPIPIPPAPPVASAQMVTVNQAPVTVARSSNIVSTYAAPPQYSYPIVQQSTVGVPLPPRVNVNVAGGPMPVPPPPPPPPGMSANVNYITSEQQIITTERRLLPPAGGVNMGARAPQVQLAPVPPPASPGCCDFVCGPNACDCCGPNGMCGGSCENACGGCGAMCSGCGGGCQCFNSCCGPNACQCGPNGCMGDCCGPNGMCGPGMCSGGLCGPGDLICCGPTQTCMCGYGQYLGYSHDCCYNQNLNVLGCLDPSWGCGNACEGGMSCPSCKCGWDCC